MWYVNFISVSVYFLHLESSTSRPLSARMRCQSANVALRNVEDTSFVSHNKREITSQFLKEDHCSKLTHGVCVYTKFIN